MADIQLQYEGGKKVGTYPCGAALVEVGHIVQKSVLGVITESAGADTEALGGIAAETVDNSGGAAGDLNIQVVVEGVVKVTVASSGSSAIGAEVYASDDTTLTITGTGNLPVGYLVRQTAASSTVWWVYFNEEGRSAVIPAT